MKKKDRQMNYELLRIIAMLMIVCLHYLSKGGALGDPKQELTTNGYLAWLIEAFCLVAVNVYVLISGYFGVDSQNFTIRKPLKIWRQVWFYSVGIGLIMLIAGAASWNLYQGMTYVFPVVTEHYWFATAYLLLCLLMPFLNAGVENLDQKTFQWILIGMLLVFSVAKTVLPMQLPWDHKGYDAFWFVFLYLTGAYLKKYKISGGIKWLFVYVTGVFAIYLSFLMLQVVYLKLGKLGDFISYSYSYNYLFTYVASIGLFLAFANVGKNWKEKTQKIISTLAGATFGVYLIHEHVELRGLWKTLFHCESYAHGSTGMFMLHMLGTVCVVYIVCTIIELLRQKITELLTNAIKRNE